MMGSTHATCGWLAGLLTLPVAPVSGFAECAAWVITCAGCALLPDLDEPKSSIGSMWGPISQSVATVVRVVARGHRWGTHDIILSPLAYAFIASWATRSTLGSAILLAVVVGLSLKALGLSGVTKIGPLLNLGLSALIGVQLAPHVAAHLDQLALVVALGVLVHCAGDLVTERGLPVPVLWIWRRKRFAIPLFETGKKTERRIAVVLNIAVVWQLVVVLGGPDRAVTNALHFVKQVGTELFPHLA
ncbi:metal-dependent hydrolase [Austwickia chelonae]|uniref:metal-dependent hydrolase n=1 Tax=Austwickia chelonae TaxID=100225 RepID=UPI000E26CF92|nr:metal-dependent hydrolase [Austwickia chelonae]